MHDWKQLVHDSLSRLRLNGCDAEETVAELANHHLRMDGLPEAEAFERCMSQLLEVQMAARDFERAKAQEGSMNYRSKTLWLPGLVTLTLASVLLMVLGFFAFSKPKVHWVDGGAIVLSGVWLLSLTFCGALGAHLSRRAGGTRLSCLLAATFPASTMLAVFCFVLPVAIFIERNNYVIHHPLYFGLAMLNWTVLPGAFLLLGAVAVSRGKKSVNELY